MNASARAVQEANSTDVPANPNSKTWVFPRAFRISRSHEVYQIVLAVLRCRYAAGAFAAKSKKKQFLGFYLLHHYLICLTTSSKEAGRRGKRRAGAMPSSRSGNAANIQRKAHAAAAEGDRDALVALLAPPKTCSWSWWSRGSKGPDLIDPATGDTLLHSAARCLEPSSSCRALVGELLSGSEHLPCIDARSVNFQLETPLHVALFERRVAPAEARGGSSEETTPGSCYAVVSATHARVHPLQVLLEHAASRLGGSGEADALALLNAKDIHNWTALDAAADGALWGLAVRMGITSASAAAAVRALAAAGEVMIQPRVRAVALAPQGRLCALGASPQNCGRFVRASAPALAFPASVAEAAAQRAGAGAAGSSVLTAIFEAAKAQAKTASIRVQESRIERMAAERADTRMSAHAFRSTDEVLSWRAEAIARVAEALCIPPVRAENNVVC